MTGLQMDFLMLKVTLWVAQLSSFQSTSLWYTWVNIQRLWELNFCIWMELTYEYAAVSKEDVQMQELHSLTPANGIQNRQGDVQSQTSANLSLY